MFRIAPIANFLIRSFFIFLIVYLWASYFISSFFITFLVALLVTLVANYAWMFWVYRRRRAKNQTKAQIDNMNKVMLQFKFMTQATTISFFAQVFNSTQPEEQTYKVNVYSNKITIEKNDTIYNFFPLFHTNPTKEQVIECLNNCNPGEKCVVAAYQLDAEVTAFFQALDIDIVLMPGERIYQELLEPTEIFPKILIQEKKSIRLSFKRLGAIMFARKKVKSYIFVGIIILFTSMIIRPTIYYIVMATLIFGLALISFLRGSLPSKEKVFG